MKIQRVIAENPMAATWTKAAKVRRAFKSGKKRRKDVEYDAERGVIECRIAFINIRAAMLVEGIATTVEDVKVALAMMTPAGGANVVHLVPLPRGMEELPQAYAEAATFEESEKAVPLGIVFWQKDREADEANQVNVWVQPWLTSQRATRAAAEARLLFLRSDDETTATFT